MLRPLKPGAGGGTHSGGGGGGSWSDQDLQTTPYSANYTLDSLFQGQGFTGAMPPDTNLAVGINNGTTQIVQGVNTSVAMYQTNGTLLLSGDLGLSLFAYLPATANCNANMDGGDVIVKWDQLDGRWIFSQLAYNSTFSQNDLCLAISETSDATGSYFLYDISFGGDVPDYPKLAIWGDGIYFSANMFHISVNAITGRVSSKFLGARACSFPRPIIDPSNPTNPPDVSMTCSAGNNTAVYNILPADLDGSTTAPTTAGDYYLQFAQNLTATSGNQLDVYQLQSGNLVSLGTLSVSTYNEACGGSTCIPQSGTTQQLDSLGDRLMYRLSYRNYGASQAMVVNHSVQVSSSGNQTGIRWYRLCGTGNAATPFTVCSQSTFSPDSTTYRWMGSIAQDHAGDLALGYSTSSSAIYPSITITGNEPGEDGMENELQILKGPNFQDTYNRWGDYSAMAVDPKDDCTFWYTTEYSTTTNVFGIDNFFWGTAIGSYHFPSCTPNP